MGLCSLFIFGLHRLLAHPGLRRTGWLGHNKSHASSSLSNSDEGSSSIRKSHEPLKHICKNPRSWMFTSTTSDAREVVLLMPNVLQVQPAIAKPSDSLSMVGRGRHQEKNSCRRWSQQDMRQIIRFLGINASQPGAMPGSLCRNMHINRDM